MTKDDEDNLLRWLQDKDVSEVMSLLMEARQQVFKENFEVF